MVPAGAAQAHPLRDSPKSISSAQLVATALPPSPPALHPSKADGASQRASINTMPVGGVVGLRGKLAPLPLEIDSFSSRGSGHDQTGSRGTGHDRPSHASSPDHRPTPGQDRASPGQDQARSSAPGGGSTHLSGPGPSSTAPARHGTGHAAGHDGKKLGAGNVSLFFSLSTPKLSKSDSVLTTHRSPSIDKPGNVAGKNSVRLRGGCHSFDGESTWSVIACWR